MNNIDFYQYDLYSYAPTNFGQSDPNFTGWWSATYNFTINNLDTTTASSISIDSFWPDDRSVVLLNGVEILANGMQGSNEGGVGIFQFTRNGSYTTQNFLAHGSGYSSSIAFLTNGLNTLEFIVNNTNNGIYENTVVGGNTEAGLSGSLTYSTASAVPLPSSIIMFASGLLGIAVTRYKKA